MMKYLCFLCFLPMLWALPETPEDHQKRMELMEKAFAKDPVAMYRLGKHFSFHQADGLALKWWKEAGELGHVQALKDLAILVRNHRVVKKPELHERDAYLQLLRLDEFSAHLKLGEFYTRKKNPLYDIEKAVLHFQDAFSKGLHQAAFELGELYYRGRSDIPEFELAWTWFDRGAQHKHPECLRYIGIMLRYGLHVKIAPERCWSFYRQASDLGSAQASFDLAEAYREGKDLPQDLNLARFFYNRAVRGNLPEAQKKLDTLK